MKNFPKPRKLGVNCTRWTLSDLLRYEAARHGQEPPELLPEDERFLSARQVAARYNSSMTTIWRWAREAAA